MTRAPSVNELDIQATPASNGVAVLSFPALTVRQRRVIQQITVYSTSTTSTTATVYKNTRFWAGTINGNFDVATGLPYLNITGSDVVQVQWTGCSQTDSSSNPTQCVATFFYVDE